MRIMSCNVRCEGAQDGPNDWIHRRELCAEVMLSRQPDVICCQEVWEGQVADLRRLLKGYAWFGTIDEPHTRRPVNSIFYRSARLELLSAGAYWLSETPHVCGSRSWNSDCVRLACWLRLVDGNSGREFRLVNTHLDHRSQPAREGQAGVLNEDAAAYPAEFAQVLTGDMNADASNRAIARLKEHGWHDAWEAVHGSADPGGTFHAFHGADAPAPPRIDWIFTRGEVRPVGAEVIRDRSDGRYPSDHYFITADLEL